MATIIVILLISTPFVFLGWTVYDHGKEFEEMMEDYERAIEEEAREVARQRQESIR
jgi:hypothetical protein